ncbi:hypothetical protein AB1D73_002124, partial [Staphylococcus pseudintermedius]
VNVLEFNGWNIVVEYKDDYEILKNDTSVVILDKDNDIAALIKEVNNELKIAKSGYSNTYTINAEEKKLTVEITNLFEED